MKKSDLWTYALKLRITRKLLKIDRYMLRGVRQALNCLSIHATYCMIVAGASPDETKMWAAVRENGDFLPEDIVRQNPAGYFLVLLR